MLLARRLTLPPGIEGLLLDLDGVLVDTLGLEAGCVDEILGRHVAAPPPIPAAVFRAAFPLPIPESWRSILAALRLDAGEELVDALTRDLERLRLERVPAVLPGVHELVEAARDRMAVAVVSNNPAEQVAAMLEATGLGAPGMAVVGNDQGLESKPAPDMYLEGARRLGLAPSVCAAVEDSRLGARAARLAGCFVVGVATGADDFSALEGSPDVDRAYESFEAPVVSLAPGDVTAKSVVSPNEFVSHMVEHIAWRSGCAVDLRWHSDDWAALGRALGEQLSPLLDGDGTTWAMGLIDDGSAQVALAGDDGGGLRVLGDAEELGWFRELRVEQLPSGAALETLLGGLAEATRVGLTVTIGAVEDAHHTWEAVFRAVGLGLRDRSSALVAHAAQAAIDRPPGRGFGLEVTEASPAAAGVVRTTAESVCSTRLELGPGRLDTALTTSASVDAHGLVDLLGRLAAAAGVHGELRFEATELSSSHVVAEDVGMTLGAAFKALALARMREHGIEGFGWGVGAEPRDEGTLKVALSWEGRRFLKLLPVGWGERELKRFRVGTTLGSGLFSEDLDDFLDGFVRGMDASVMVHWPRTDDLDGSWAAIFADLGAALAMALRPNHARRGLIAGVKATLV